jgi:OmcA/MtrC family decaheme c-type cytochrome
MHPKPLKRLGGLLLATATALALISCNGSTGSTGATGATGATGQAGANGSNGANGANGSNGSAPALNLASMASSDWSGLTLTGSVTSVDLSQATPVVSFKVTTSDGTPVAGLSASTSQAATAVYPSYTQFGFGLAKLVPAGDGSNTTQWVSYLIDGMPTLNGSTVVPATPAHPTTDNTGTMTEDGFGNYTYTFRRNIKGEAAWLASQVAAGYFTGTAASGNYAPDLGDVSYQPSLTHRLAIRIGAPFPGTGTSTPTGAATTAPAVYPAHSANIIYEFVPGATGVAPNANPITTDRQIVNVAVCNNCHTNLGGTGTVGTGSNTAPFAQMGLNFHSGQMNDPNYCFACHNEQLKYTATDGLPDPATALATMALTSASTKVNGLSVGNTVEWIHKFHMGANLGYTNNVQKMENGWYPQDIRKCTTCHQAVTDSTGKVLNPQYANWQTVPSREACGACHDTVNFATGNIAPGGINPKTGLQNVHGGLNQPDDRRCADCHSAADIVIYHTPLQSPAENGSDGSNTHAAAAGTNSWQAADPTNMPLGAYGITYAINSVTVNAATNPVINFTIMVTAPNQPAAAATITPYSASLPGSAEMVSNFSLANGPTLGIQGAMAQDGIAAPTDYNIAKETDWTLKSIWNGTALIGATPVSSTGIVAGANGSYTITLDGIKMPAGTKLMGLGLGWTPFIQTNLGAPVADLTNLAKEGTPNFAWTPSASQTATGTGGLQLPAKNVWADCTTGGFSARRTIIAANACTSCHGDLGIFTPNTTAPNSYASNFHNGYMNDPQHCDFCHTVAGTTAGWSYNAKTWIHGLHAGGFRTNAYTAQPNFPRIVYSGVLNDCEACHVPGSYDFSNTTNAGQIAGMLWDVNAVGYYPANKVAVPVSGIPGAAVVNMVPAPTASAASLQTTYTPPAVGSYVAPWITPAGTVTTTTTATTVTTSYSPDATLFGVNPIAGTPSTKNGVTTTPAPSFYAGQWVLGATQTWTLQQPDPGRVVTSPITAACSSCHDSQTAINHMVQVGGGVYYQVASTVPTPNTNGTSGTTNSNPAYPVLKSTETCLVCHGAGTENDIQKVHMNFSGANLAN